MTLTRAMLIVAIPAFLATASATHAVTLFTPPLAPDGSNLFKCRLANVTDHVIDCAIETFGTNGDRVAEAVVTLGPRESDLEQAPASGQQLYCKFTCRAGRRAVRASATVFEPGTGTICAVPAD